MKTFIATIFLLSFLISPTLSGWELTWSEEFNNQKKVDTSVWNVFYWFSPGIINEELEFYSPDAFTFTDNSILRIIAEHRPWYTYRLNYTSGVLTTKSKFSQAYGYFELRTRLPKGVGFWPAFWLLPESANKPLEIDIFEILEQAPSVVHTTFHCDYSPNNPNNKGSSATVSALNDGGFHVYGLQWIPGTLIWYVDGSPVFNLTNECIPNTPEFILINNAIGGDWPKPPDNTTPFPSYMDLDYVRVYKQLGSGKGINLPGSVGGGIDFSTPKIDPPYSPFSFGLVTANPETVDGPSSSLTISVNLVCNNGSWTGMKLQFGLAPYTLSPIGNDDIFSVTLPGLSLSAPNTYRYDIHVVIPGGTSPGYYRGNIGIFDSNWKNLIWLNTVVMVGVGQDYIVGAKTQ